MGTEQKNLESLVNQALKGHEAAFKELYNLFSKPMFNICIRMVGKAAEAEDIIQDSFISAFNSLKQLKDKKMFGPWLRRIVVNNCIKHLKARMEFRNEPTEELPEEIEEKIFEKTDYTALHNAIKELPNGCREIFLLYTSENYSHKEIGTLLNISESTSKSQYGRAKKLLKQRLIDSDG